MKSGLYPGRACARENGGPQSQPQARCPQVLPHCRATVCRRVVTDRKVQEIGEARRPDVVTVVADPQRLPEASGVPLGQQAFRQLVPQGPVVPCAIPEVARPLGSPESSRVVLTPQGEPVSARPLSTTTCGTVSKSRLSSMRLLASVNVDGRPCSASTSRP